MTDYLQALIIVQAQINGYRRSAASVQLTSGLAPLLFDLADDVEARTRRLDAEAADCDGQLDIKY